ncbi:MAG TPA: SCO family protein [Chitinophagales bacterium]|nr:SCO family protein [Chitinophagales bacterium]
MRRLIFLCGFISLVLNSCNNGKKLPFYGPKTVSQKIVDGKQEVDSVNYSIPGFTMTDQDSNTVNEGTVNDKIYVADFFFTSCPSICPKMMKEMGYVYDKYKGNGNIQILSFSIDPERDSVGRLKDYAKRLGNIDGTKWHLLTGNKDSIYELAKKYLVSATEDPDAPGGHIHDGNFILIDTKSRIRGYYDGTDDESVKKLMNDMDILLSEK